VKPSAVCNARNRVKNVNNDRGPNKSLIRTHPELYQKNIVTILSNYDDNITFNKLKTEFK